MQAPPTPVLLVTGPTGAFEVLVGDGRAVREIVAAFLAAHPTASTWYDPDARELGTDTGLRIARWRAPVLGANPRFALVVTVAGRPADVYLVDESEDAIRVAAALDPVDAGGLAMGAEAGVRFTLVRVTRLGRRHRAGSRSPLRERPRDRRRHGDAAAIRISRGQAGRPRGPRPELDPARRCPRCQTSPLHREPIFDDHDLTGRAICAACAAQDAVAVS